MPGGRPQGRHTYHFGDQVPVSNVEWLAGLLEGEGCFTRGRTRNRWYPRITLSMTDRDVVERAAGCVGGGPMFIQNRRQRPTLGSWTKVLAKTIYTFNLSSLRALTVMLAVFPFMGERRRGRIEQLLTEWEHA